MEGQEGLLQLPDELLLRVLSHLPVPDLKSLSCTCRRFSEHQADTLKLTEEAAKLRVSQGVRRNFSLLPGEDWFDALKFVHRQEEFFAHPLVSSSASPSTSTSRSSSQQQCNLALGDQITTFVSNTGEVYSCGCNSSGKLGHDDEDDRLKLSLVHSLRPMRITQVSG
eukprot:CAMPEP_0197854166 /NCGR_PEP_ID=MMETSP1438-20131217/24140_1 /TAXON_ID=1461541 /ORGANISM="Pterosperma sp., Strain CCMP1384" /LENGTH=166 /DNA_ID=CAMNT_0043468813 /DNA_START=90 /DNA_END=586 /DNA_ORIENTATION=+